MRKFWTVQKIEAGFERFKNESGRLPLAPEIDELDYLPSSRHIQKKFGGLAQLRKELGYEDTHFGKGSYRSEIAHRVNKKGRNAELLLEKILRDKFGEVFVHTEKMFSNSKNRVDFYVYSPNGNFGIDVFCAETMRYLQSNINIKMDKYKEFTDKLFFVVVNESIKQKDLENYSKSKIKPLWKTMEIVTLGTFLDYIRSQETYPNPLV